MLDVCSSDLIGGYLVGDLDQPAFKADLRVEREGRLILGDVARPDEGLRRRVIVHREKQIGIGREAGAELSECGHRLGFPVLAGHVQATAARDVAMLATKSSKVWCMKSIRSEEHTSELQPLMRISYAVFCLTQQHNRSHSVYRLYYTTLT